MNILCAQHHSESAFLSSSGFGRRLSIIGSANILHDLLSSFPELHSATIITSGHGKYVNESHVIYTLPIVSARVFKGLIILQSRHGQNNIKATEIAPEPRYPRERSTRGDSKVILKNIGGQGPRGNLRLTWLVGHRRAAGMQAGPVQLVQLNCSQCGNRSQW